MNNNTNETGTRQGLQYIPLVLIGLGPHSKRIYIHYLIKHGLAPKIIIELSSKKQDVEKFLKQKGLDDTLVYYVDDSIKYSEVLPEKVQSELKNILSQNLITHAIISTEPKAHFSYIQFFLQLDIHTLVDKPITSPVDVANNEMMAKKILDDYNTIINIYKEKKKKGVNCQVQCQRRWHEGYLFIRNLLKETISNYHIPITSMDVYHCDGMWNMPDEFLFRENHPYKYGYGKLFHSGYHFFDLMSWMISLNNILEQKKIDNVELYSTVVRPNHFFEIINKEDYHRLFGTAKFDNLFDNKAELNLDSFGEIDCYSLIQFNKAQTPISICSVNLIQNGFSRRSWTELPEDTYKGNGRVRHERVNIQVGPLMNIQVHSYQSAEIKDRGLFNHNDVGALEHFDIYIFRNVDLIGGKPFEKISIDDIVKEQSCSFIGYNERARENCLMDFLNNVTTHSDILDHEMTIKLLSNTYSSIVKRKQKENPIVQFAL